MKKALKRSLSLLLAIALIFSSTYVGFSEVDFSGLFAIKAKAASSGTCGENLTWTLDDEGTLTIRGTGDMYNFYYLDYDFLEGIDTNIPWRNLYENIVKVDIEEGVTSIGDYAFNKCTSLISCNTLPKGA